jgi:hypothetical protein
MRTFPQLVSGAIAQYPLTKIQHVRTVTNLAPSGNVWRYGDSTSEQISWLLEYNGLTDAEFSTLRDFFEACEGSLRSFTFLDPAGNLLAHSENLQESVWSADPGIQSAAGPIGPNGISSAVMLTNSAQASQSIVQQLAAPAGYHYCLSFYAKSDQAQEIQSVMYSDSGDLTTTHRVSSSWQRYRLSGRPGAASEEVRFGLALAPGVIVDVFGFQVEAQPGSSEYKKTDSVGGVYPRARLAEDSFSVTGLGVGVHRAAMRVISTKGLE